MRLTPWYQGACQPIDKKIIQQARAHQNQLTKPQGSLGELENISVQFCGWQNTLTPQCDAVTIRVFAADHGIAEHPVSAFPQAVTAQMVYNFIQGGGAINVLAQRLSADFAIINAGIKHDFSQIKSPLFINTPVAYGSQDFSQQPAMDGDTLAKALALGKKNTANLTADIFIAGEMGIGNTTSASALYSALLAIEPENSVGTGTGVNDQGVKQKVALIRQSLQKYVINSPISALQTFGGLEIAAIVGAYIHCAQQGMPILVDGFICTIAAVLACKINKGVRPWMLFAHQSAEPAHQHALSALNATPLLTLGMRLGEGSGAGVAVPLIQNALCLHNQMATFANAQVDKKIS